MRNAPSKPRLPDDFPQSTSRLTPACRRTHMCTGDPRSYRSTLAKFFRDRRALHHRGLGGPLWLLLFPCSRESYTRKGLHCSDVRYALTVNRHALVPGGKRLAAVLRRRSKVGPSSLLARDV